MAIGWQSAELVEIRPETARASTFRLALSEPVQHLPGQHYVLRLTAPDGYTASRSYSVASAPDDSGCIELTVEHLVDRRPRDDRAHHTLAMAGLGSTCRATGSRGPAARG